ncbi:MAG TPA: ATP-binding protein [Gemmatimonadaceae bacterium]|nr:ATP-binding protein [Gemmatimonadaceae bacterium]
MLSAAGLDILGALRTGIVSVLPDGTVSAVNDAAADALGVNESRHIGTDFWSAFPALHDGRAHEQIEATRDDGMPRVFHAALPGGRADSIHEIRVARTRAGLLVFEIRETPHVRDSSGDESDPLRDVARRMAAGSDSEALLGVLCDTALEICGAHGAAVARLTGADAIVVAAAGVDAVGAGTVFPIADSLAGNALRSRALIVEHQDPALAWPLFSGTKDIGDVAVAPLVAADHPVGLLAAWHTVGRAGFSVRDRNRLRALADHAAVVLVKARLLEQAQAAAHAKGVFLATISHELRTPLTALTGYGELLADEILGPLTPHQADMVDRMRSVTHQLAVMVDELLTFSALEAGRESVRLQDVSIVEILDAVVTVVEPLARHRELPLSINFPERPPMLYTDADKVRQILVNLIGNAVKFTDQGRVDVDVDVARRNGELRIAVRDTGIGIRPADRARLFQPFTQLDAGLTRRHGGTGLGLYNSGRLAQLLGGRVDVDSEPGVGSTFTLIIPARYSRVA